MAQRPSADIVVTVKGFPVAPSTYCPPSKSFMSVFQSQKIYFLIFVAVLFVAVKFFLADYLEKSRLISDSENQKTVLVVLSPHFDDAVLSVGGIISEFAGPKYIVTFFRTPTTTKQYLTEWDKISGFKKSSDAGVQRIKENNVAGEIVGAKLVNENQIDFQYDNRNATTSLQIKLSIEKEIEDVITSFVGEKIMIVGPSYFGDKYTHPDHLLLSESFAEVAGQKYPNVKFYFYEDLPYTYHKFRNGKIKLQEILSQKYPNLKFQ
jgi:LmbE family N-acetylglucosaminyl deacetylase